MDVMCAQKIDTSSKNRNVTIVWLDPYCSKQAKLARRKRRLLTVNDHILLYDDVEECLSRCQLIKKEKLLLIVAGRCANAVVPRCNTIRQIDIVFIYCRHTNVHKYMEISKVCKIVAGIFTQYDELVHFLAEHIFIVNEQLKTFHYFRQHQRYIRHLSVESVGFLWFHVFRQLILLLPHDECARQDMLDTARHYYRRNQVELQRIDEFQRIYNTEHAIKWYTKNSFVYRLLNKALRTEDVEQLYAFRYYIRDLSVALANKHKVIISLGDPVTVYRGVQLTQSEFNKLIHGKGQLISMNGFMSTTLTRQVAKVYAGKPTSDKLSVLLEISCDVEKLGSSVVFAFIGAQSNFEDENEVLFDIGSSFKFESASEDKNAGLWHVKMIATDEGHTLVNDDIRDIMDMKECSAKLIYGILLCDMGKYHESLVYFKRLLAHPENEDIPAIHLNLSQALGNLGNHEEEWQHLECAYKLMMDAQPPRPVNVSHVLLQMGTYWYEKLENDRAIEYYEQGLNLYQQVSNSVDSIVALAFLGLGSCYDRKGDSHRAMIHYKRAMQIVDFKNDKNTLAVCARLTVMGGICLSEHKYDDALIHFQNLYSIQTRILPAEHQDIASNLLDIGQTLIRQKKYAEAMPYLFRAEAKLKNKQTSPTSSDLCDTINCIGIAWYNVELFDEALKCFRHALKIDRESHPDTHPDVAILGNISNAYLQLRKYKLSIEFGMKALRLLKRTCAPDDPDIADQLLSVGSSYMTIGSLKRAMHYFLQARKIFARKFPGGRNKAWKELEKQIVRLKRRVRKQSSRQQQTIKIRELLRHHLQS